MTTPNIPVEPATAAIPVPSTVSVSDFAMRIGEGPAKVVGELMKNGVMATINETIDFETASIIASELGYTITEEILEETPRPSHTRDAQGHVQERPPVVTVMGHVDHGKTSLLDAIRETSIASGEAGGITQHIAAYQATRGDRVITFLDTPGHEAFHAIRAHGVKITDVVVIVIAADDGVKQQTKEAVKLAREAEVGIVVAINKVDKAEANVDRVKQEMAALGVLPDGPVWGGDVPFVEVSAKSKAGLDELLDMILLVSDIDKPTAVFEGLAQGVIIESHIESGRGPIITLLVEEGQLKVGDFMVAGSTYGKVRALEDFRGKKLKVATPGTPAVVLGFKAVADFGDWFEGVHTEREARDWLTTKDREGSIKSLTKPKSVSAGDIDRAVTEGQVKELAVLVKADAQGSLESVIQALQIAGNDEVRVRVVQSGVGDITENDINTATASGALVLGFHVAINSSVNQLAKRNGVTFKLYKVIYELLDDVREWLSSMLPPETIETELGTLEILAIFKVTKDKIITGGKVLQGQLENDARVQIIRDAEVLDEVDLIELRRGADLIQGAQSGEEVGLSLARATVLPEVGDTLRFLRRRSQERRLEA